MVHFWYLNPPFALKKQPHRQNIVSYILPIGAYFHSLRQIITLITTFGLIHGKHSGNIQKVVTIDELFT